MIVKPKPQDGGKEKPKERDSFCIFTYVKLSCWSKQRIRKDARKFEPFETGCFPLGMSWQYGE